MFYFVPSMTISQGIVATVGGDAAEFILALTIAQQFGIYLDEYVVAGLFRSYIAKMEPLRKFYMHTDQVLNQSYLNFDVFLLFLCIFSLNILVF